MVTSCQPQEDPAIEGIEDLKAMIQELSLKVKIQNEEIGFLRAQAQVKMYITNPLLYPSNFTRFILEQR